MTIENSAEIARQRDGSIDYGHYAARASIARNREVKHLSGRLLETCTARGPGISALAAVVLLAIIL